MTMGADMDSDGRLQQRLQEEPQDSPAEIVSALKQMTDPPVVADASSLALGSFSNGLPKKLRRASDDEIEGKQELGFVSGAERNQEGVDLVSGVGCEYLARKVQKGNSGVGSFSEIEEKQQVSASVPVKEAIVGGSEDFLGKEMDVNTLLEVKKKKLLDELEVRFEASAKINGSCQEMHNDGGNARRSLKIQVIDETALIEYVSVPKPGNGRGKEMGFVGSAKDTERKGLGNAKQELDGKKAKQSRAKAKGSRKVLGTNERLKNVTHMAEAQRGCQKNGGRSRTKRMYSREEMEALRFVQIVQQRKMWKEVYNGFGLSVAREYDDLASVRHQKQPGLNLDPRQRFGKNTAPGILVETPSERVDNELGDIKNSESDYANTLGPVCSHSVGGESDYTDLEEEFNEEYDTDEDYASIQKPAFLVHGEPNFDSGPAEDGLEYLRRVRWEAAHIPKVKVAKLDRSKFKKEQSVSVPKIADIAKCPGHLLPSKQWEDAFLAEFSELRLALSNIEGSSHSQQLSQDIILESDNLRSDEVDSIQPLRSFYRLSSLGLPSLTAEESDVSKPPEFFSSETYADESLVDYPTISVLLRLDYVARASMLRKCISSVESMNALSRNDCVWLFALCVAVDTPLDADTCSALRSLLRKCASLRAGKSEHDEELVMLNIMATISGRYFGQLES